MSFSRKMIVLRWNKTKHSVVTLGRDESGGGRGGRGGSRIHWGGAIVYRTYATHKHLYISLLLVPNFRSCLLCRPPVTAVGVCSCSAAARFELSPVVRRHVQPCAPFLCLVFDDLCYVAPEEAVAIVAF